MPTDYVDERGVAAPDDEATHELAEPAVCRSSECS